MTPRHGEGRFAAEIAADPDRIWSTIRDFGRAADWNPVASSSRLVVGTDITPGIERELLTADGQSVLERLTGLDDHAHRLDYEMLSFPIPVMEQRNQITVDQATKGWSLVTFTARFAPADGVAIDEIAAINRTAFAAAAGGIGRLLDADVRPSAGSQDRDRSVPRSARAVLNQPKDY
ncbi:SRPBCC family protein [Sphingomonas faeni]|uniref:SRPBCC family protein n=1 Tax=Sphingomonas faeni TaxID=185950 RepID=UPI00277FE9D1|nr:SRPBCC family protein [Sphingomonas faeni]MDQ0837034.1 hypothetical protein [Sphingomonas faeni]